MNNENNKSKKTLKSEFFLKLFCIPAVIWLFLSLFSMTDQSDPEPMTWGDFFVGNILILGIWFAISFLIARFHKEKEKQNIKVESAPDKEWEETSILKKIRFPLIMSIITFLIGIFLSYDSIGFPLGAQLIIFVVAFIPCILFVIFTIVIYKNKKKRKVYSIFKTISTIVTCLLLFYYFIAMFVVVLTEAINPMTNPKYYSFHIPDKKVFPQKIPKDVEDVKFLYAPGILQGGTRYTLYYVDKKMTLDEFDKKYKKQAEWIGHKDEYKDKSGLMGGVFYSTPSEYKNENDYVIYLIDGNCDDSGYCNHGNFLIAAFNKKTNEVVYSTESW